LPAVTHVVDKQQASTVSLHLPFLHRSVRDFYELVDCELLKTLADEVGRHYLKENNDCFYFNTRGGLRIEQNKLDEAAEAFLAARNALTEKVSHEIGYAVFLGQAEVPY